MPLTEHARRYLINEGIKPEMVIKTGSPMKEILNHYSSKIDNSEIMKSLNLDIDNYFLVSAHREENIDSDNNFNCLLESLSEIVEVFNKKVIVSTHPRMMKKLKGNLNNSKATQVGVCVCVCVREYLFFTPPRATMSWNFLVI